MMNEKKKEGAAQEVVDKKRQRQTNNDNSKPSSKKTSNHGRSKLEEMKERMRKKRHINMARSNSPQPPPRNKSS